MIESLTSRSEDRFTMVSPFLFKQSVRADGHLCRKYNIEILSIPTGILKILVKLLDINASFLYVVFASTPHGRLPTESRMLYFPIQDMVFTYDIVMSTLTVLHVYESPPGEMI